MTPCLSGPVFVSVFISNSADSSATTVDSRHHHTLEKLQGFILLALILQDDHRSQNTLFKQSSFFIGMLIKNKLLAAFFKTFFFGDCCLNSFSFCLFITKKETTYFSNQKSILYPKKETAAHSYLYNTERYSETPVIFTSKLPDYN